MSVAWCDTYIAPQQSGRELVMAKKLSFSELVAMGVPSDVANKLVDAGMAKKAPVSKVELLDYKPEGKEAYLAVKIKVGFGLFFKAADLDVVEAAVKEAKERIAAGEKGERSGKGW